MAESSLGGCVVEDSLERENDREEDEEDMGESRDLRTKKRMKVVQEGTSTAD